MLHKSMGGKARVKKMIISEYRSLALCVSGTLCVCWYSTCTDPPWLIAFTYSFKILLASYYVRNHEMMIRVPLILRDGAEVHLGAQCL